MNLTPIAIAVADTLRTDLLIWVDLETTGLDVSDNMRGMHNHKILEIGMHITDKDYNIIGEGFEVVIHHEKEEILPLMNDYVVNMHTENGLFDRIEKSTVTLAAAEQMMLDYVNSFSIKHGVCPIAGNNVGFDKNFIDAQMPAFAKVLHYRKLDVSSFKIVAWNNFPEEAAQVVKQMKHRGLEDIQESIAELKHYMNTIMKQK
jgi:oligoribonuclease